ncbi:MAG: PhzF family phenazine biosynthesis protein [Nitrospiraceae bacterium]|nr:PhzF family phenazine biosynthesis protein [Nitrospiraceae bacterium]
MQIPYYHIDAFTSKIFSGNPAAVCLLDKWLDDNVLLCIAAENNLSETAFIVPASDSSYHLRWFTPEIEVDLCGHATLASAFVIFSFINSSLSSVDFDTKSGKLTVLKSDNLLSMNFPARKPMPAEMPLLLSEALGAEPVKVLRSRDLMAVFDNESIVGNMNPDFDKLRLIKDCFGIIVTAPGLKSDFVSRFFAPNAGIPEDPVTGSAHCTLIPYWAERLGKDKLTAHQLSKRGGELFCENLHDRVNISGRAALYAKGYIHLD